MAKELEKRPRTKFIRQGNGELIDAPTLARSLDESVFTIRKWRRAGIIPYIDFCYRTKRYRLKDVLAALEKRTLKAK
jgi:hypothetical protein